MRWSWICTGAVTQTRAALPLSHSCPLQFQPAGLTDTRRQPGLQGMGWAGGCCTRPGLCCAQYLCHPWASSCSTQGTLRLNLYPRRQPRTLSSATLEEGTRISFPTGPHSLERTAPQEVRQTGREGNQARPSDWLTILLGKLAFQRQMPNNQVTRDESSRGSSSSALGNNERSWESAQSPRPPPHPEGLGPARAWRYTQLSKSKLTKACLATKARWELGGCGRRHRDWL